MKKKLILLFSCLFLFTSIFAFPASAAGDEGFTIDFETNCNAIFMKNLDTGTVVFTKNADERIEPTSTTKILTYIVVSENVEDIDGTTVTLTQELKDSLEGTGSSIANIMVGETMSIYEALNCLMVQSGNDAAVILADYVGGRKNQETGNPEKLSNIDRFVQMMNDKAAELGCTGTHFANPDGLHDEKHYTTARDMGIMAEYAMDLPRFMDIVSQTYHIVPATNMQEDRRLETTNLMMLPGYPDYYYQYVTGIKTGWHDQAGDCIVTTAKAEGYAYLCVAMGSPHVAGQNPVPDNGAMIDSKALYRWAFRTFTLKSIVDMEKPLAEVNLNLAWEKDTLLLVPEKDVTALLPNDVDLNSIVVSEVEKPESVNAPITKGEILGKATLSYANHELATINLVASEDVQRSDLLYYWEGAKNIISSPWFLGICGLFVLLFIIYLIIATIYNRRDRRKRKVKKYRKF